MRIIQSQADVDEGADWLVKRDPVLARAYEVTGPLPLRRKGEGFAELVHAIVAQQVSVSSAAAMSAKVREAGFCDPSRVLIADDDDLRAIGLTRQKTRYIRALAEADIDFDGLRLLPDQEAQKVLIQVTGIGVWTAEIYLMFSLGRPDVFAAGDLALQEAVKILYALDQRPTERELRTRAEAWSPWRAVAARLFWAYYMAARNWEGPW